MVRKMLCSLLAVTPFIAFGQFGRQWSASEIQHEIQKLNTLGRVLYIAAHPDDENTRLIAHLANKQQLEVAYLSLTRGDGGQNLIGTEIGTELGLIRTQELLAARRTDGGQQFFTRALDFGYSKSPEESFEFWDREAILDDVVWVIRRFQPDVIINRFAAEGSGGHGHHTASAILSIEAFELAANPEAFPHHLQYVDAWQPQQLWHNVSTWWDKSLPEKAEKDSSIISLEVSDYSPLLGRSIGEIASLSRSQHRSQGFGTTLQRGSNTEYLQWIKGDNISSRMLTESVDGWAAIPGGTQVEDAILEVMDGYDPAEPSASIPGLVKVAKALEAVDASRFRNSKLELVRELIAQCSGFWMEANTGFDQVTPGSTIKVDVSLLNRSKVPLVISALSLNGADTSFSQTLEYNRTLLVPMQLEVAKDHPYSEQYWLREPPTKGRFIVSDQLLRGLPESDWPFSVTADIELEGYKFRYSVPVTRKWADRAEGEQIRALTVVPPVSINPEERVVMSLNQQPTSLRVRVKSHDKMQGGGLRPRLPEGWTCDPAVVRFELDERGEEEVFTFQLTPGKKARDGEVIVEADTPEGKFDQSLKVIDYYHIPTQQVLDPSSVQAVSFDLSITGKKIGYLEGSGDDVPVALEAMGYNVTMLTVTEIGAMDLSQFDAIITGIRSYNVHPELVGVNHKLLEYVEQGGHMIVQYNVTWGLITEDIGPYPFQLSRDRVTDEHAKPTFLNKKHPIFGSPNKLTEADFEGWVQERGLYFADEWAEQFEPLISWNDPGETPVKGALIAAKYGKGTFVYTGISFFRQLPAGVPGAYRLLANIIAYGQDGE